MANLNIILLLGFIAIHYGISTPIIGGTLEGRIVTNQNHQREINSLKTPFMVYVDVVDLNDHRGPNNLLHTACGGVIIGARTVLTAAHCLAVAQRPYITVAAGVQNMRIVSKEKAQVTTADAYVMHSFYKGECKITEEKYVLCVNDIALIRTVHAFNFRPSIQAAVLAGSRSSQRIGLGWIYGWGMTESSMSSPHLRKAQMKVMPIRTCESAYEDVVFSNFYWCLESNKKNSAACPGDSGGPFVVNGIVYGLFAFSNVFEDERGAIESCDGTKPSVYLNIISYERWIKEQVKKLAPNDFKNYLKFDDGSKQLQSGSSSIQSKKPSVKPSAPNKQKSKL